MTMAALLNHLWQSTAFLATAAGLAWLLRKRQARVRFWIWMAASLKFLVPFSALAAMGSWLRWPAAPVVAPPAGLAAISRPFTPAEIVWLSGGESMGAASVAGASWLAPTLLALAAAGSLALTVRWFWRWRRLARIARAAAPAVLQGVAVRLSEAAIEPGVFGIVRPVLLLPRSLATQLTTEQMAAVLAHEQCHVRRRDNLWAALHMLVETLFWFHPLVWWLGARLVAEREQACDEEVLRRGGDREAYAASLLQVCRYYLESPLACAAGIAGGPLQQRVRQVLQGGWGSSLGRGRRWLLYGLALIAVGGPIAAGLVWAQTAAAPQQFAAASIKPAAQPGKGSGGRMMTVRIGLRVDPLHLTASYMTLAQLIEEAYDIKDYQLDAPAWMSTERFDVNAVSASPLSREQMLALLGPFLEQQFHITSHSATKTMPIYALEVGRGGFKGKPAKPGDMPTMPDRGGAGAAGVRAGELRMVTKSSAAAATERNGIGVMKFTPNGALYYSGVGPMASLVRLISMEMKRPVVDDTGLHGFYSMQVAFKPRAGGMIGPGLMAAIAARTQPPGSAPGSGANANPVPAAPMPALPTALEQQLGLKLVARQGPVKLLVIDHANKQPVGN